MDRERERKREDWGIFTGEELIYDHDLDLNF